MLHAVPLLAATRADLARHPGLRRLGGGDPGRRDRRRDVAQPGARRPQPGDDALRRGRALHRAGGRLPGRRADHRLRRRHRRPVPLRDHVPRRRPGRGHHRRAAGRPAPAGLRRSPLITLGGVLAMAATAHWVTGAKQVVGPIQGHVAGPTRRPASRPSWASSSSRPTCSPSRPPPRCSSSPWSAPSCWPAARRPCTPSTEDSTESELSA